MYHFPVCEIIIISPPKLKYYTMPSDKMMGKKFSRGDILIKIVKKIIILYRKPERKKRISSTAYIMYIVYASAVTLLV